MPPGQRPAACMQHFPLLFPGRKVIEIIQPDLAHGRPSCAVLQPPGEIVQLGFRPGQTVGLLRMHAHHAVHGGVIAGQAPRCGGWFPDRFLAQDAAADARLLPCAASTCSAGRPENVRPPDDNGNQTGSSDRSAAQRIYAPSYMPGSTVQQFQRLVLRVGGAEDHALALDALAAWRASGWLTSDHLTGPPMASGV